MLETKDVDWREEEKENEKAEQAKRYMYGRR
jgi:hypothetical protein